MLKKRTLIPLAIALVVIVAMGLVALHKSTPEAAQATHTVKPNPAPATPTSKPAGFDKTQYSTTDPASPWVVVNKQHPLNPLGYVPPDLTDVGNGQQMRAEAAAALKQMFTDAQAAGYSLTPDSGYRSYSYQITVYNGYVKQVGQAATDAVSARPGYSEHQTGWAMDIGSGGCHIDTCFGDTSAGKWAQANAYKYGFILRYPVGLTDITGYSAEAWHFRYIGPALSNELHTQGVQTLEQFFDVSGGTTYK